MGTVFRSSLETHPVNCVTAAYQRFPTLPPPCYFHKRASGIITVELRGHLSRKTSTAQNICVHTKQDGSDVFTTQELFYSAENEASKALTSTDPQPVQKFPKIFNAPHIWVLIMKFSYGSLWHLLDFCVYIWEINPKVQFSLYKDSFILYNILSSRIFMYSIPFTESSMCTK